MTQPILMMILSHMVKVISPATPATALAVVRKQPVVRKVVARKAVVRVVRKGELM